MIIMQEIAISFNNFQKKDKWPNPNSQPKLPSQA